MNALIRSIALSFTMALAIQAPSATAAPVGTEFTYQGRLQDAAQPAMGLYDFEFRLHSQLGSPGGTVTAPVVLEDVPVENGVFSVVLDFGAAQFIGDARWLSIAVRDGDSVGAYETLSPRQKLTATPYALYALSGNPGPQGPAGPAGATGVVSIHPFAGSAPTPVPAGGGGAPWTFIGPTVSVPVAAGQRVTGSAVAVLGTSPQNPQVANPVSFSLCIQIGGAGAIDSFYSGNFTDAQVSIRQSYAAAASTVPGAGNHKIGYCVKNKSTNVALTANEYVNGWVMVSN
jgi:hypothetical protein